MRRGGFHVEVEPLFRMVSGLIKSGEDVGFDCIKITADEIIINFEKGRQVWEII